MRSRRLVATMVAALFVAALFSLGGCGAIQPVRLVNKPHVTPQQSPNNMRIVLIVKDERSRSIQQANFTGLMRNGYGIPIIPVFLTHTEHLDQIVAYHLKDNFQHLGYTVVQTYPTAPSELNPQQVKGKDIDKSLRDAAWREKGTQDDEEGREQKHKQGMVDASESDTVSMSPWGPEVVVRDADYVVEFKIRKFFGDSNPWTGVHGWMAGNFAVCSTKDPQRKVLFGRKVKGFGYAWSLTYTGLFNVVLNSAYWMTLHDIEKSTASKEFQNALARCASP